MKGLILIFFLFIGTLRTGFTQSFLNLDFEYKIPSTELPRKWFVGSKGYEAEVDSIEHFSGSYSLELKFLNMGSFGVITGAFPISLAKGKKIKYSGYIKTKDVTSGYAGLWFRIDGPGMKMLGFDNMQDRGVKGTTEWQRYEIELFCDTSAIGIYFGGLLSGKGTAWFDNFGIELDGEKLQDGSPVVSEPTEKEINWLKQNVIPFNTVFAGNGFEDLMPLKKVIGDARIVGLGESTHGSSEIFKMKHRLIEFLASEMGFTVFSIEANMPEAYKVNEYIFDGRGDPKKLLQGMYFWTWNTGEVLDMIEWMKKFNESGKGRIMFTGFDMQFIDTAAAIVRRYFKEMDKKYLKDFAKNLIVIKSIRRADVTGEDIKRAADYSNEIIEKVRKNKDRYLEKHKENEYAWILQNATLINQSTNKNRDQGMADNVEWIMNNSPQGTKVVLWGHNFHIGSTYLASMGYYLKKKFGSDYIAFGFATDSGTYTAFSDTGEWIHNLQEPYAGCLEYYFMKTEMPFFILDLRNASETSEESAFITKELDFRSIGAMAMTNQFFPTNLRDEFDGIIYIAHTNHSDMFQIPKKETPTGNINELPNKLKNIPTGMDVIHTPDSVYATFEKKENMYYWYHQTSVKALNEDLEITEFGAYGWAGDHWEFGTITGNPFTKKDFSEWYNCKDGLLVKGEKFADSHNWERDISLVGKKVLWYYIAKNGKGELFKGTAIVDYLAKLKK